MKDCVVCERSFYDSTFRKRYCLAKKKIIADNSEAEKCDCYVNRYQEYEVYYGGA